VLGRRGVWGEGCFRVRWEQERQCSSGASLLIKEDGAWPPGRPRGTHRLATRLAVTDTIVMSGRWSNQLSDGAELRSRIMRSNRSRDTVPELAVRSRLHAMGFRYRVATRPLRDLRRTADMIFPRERVAVFIDGCFWHRCPAHGTMPKSNTGFWGEKLRRNVERDRETDSVLMAAGWHVIRVWEHEDPNWAAAEIAAFVLRCRHGK
jgi:DNA mismatch endonuclease (patch repair protein)